MTGAHLAAPSPLAGEVGPAVARPGGGVRQR